MRRGLLWLQGREGGCESGSTHLHCPLAHVLLIQTIVLPHDGPDIEIEGPIRLIDPPEDRWSKGGWRVGGRKARKQCRVSGGAVDHE